MRVTRVRLPGELRERIQRLFNGSGGVANAFMVEAIQRAVLAEELRRRFGADVAEAEKEMLASGEVIDARAAFAYFEARASGKTVCRPRLKAWRRPC